MMQKILTFIIVAAISISCCNNSSSYLSEEMDKKIDSLIRVMTLEEKIGQMVLFTSDYDVTGPSLRSGYLEDIRQGRCGNIFNAHSCSFIYELQKIAVEQTRLGIPLLFGYDVVHGHKTIFPISLGESASWDLTAIEKSARIAAAEAAAAGLNWTYAPMCDISVEPRWGRVSEGAGEDPYLGSLIAAARVRGFQGEDIADTLSVLACVKHFAGYGAPMAGRDYNTVDMSERYFREYYLPPYKAAVDAGAYSVMTSFNELDGTPATSNKYLLQNILRDEWGFKGFVVTDYTAINELVNHGNVADEYEAGVKSLEAGVDMDMQGAVYLKYLAEAVEKGEIKQKDIDRAARRVLEAKAVLGLFDDPYRYCKLEREKEITYNPAHLEAARDIARKSMVLLKNDSALPLVKGEKIAVIGELATSTRDYLGSWKAAGDWNFMSSVLEEIKKFNGADNTLYAKGCATIGDDRSGFDEALRVARKADKVVMVIGENWNWTGEAASRTSIDIPGVQSELLEKIAALGKKVVVVLMNGRPLALSKESELADAILEAWYPGTMGGAAVTDVLFGEYNPSGKLTMTFPRTLGQVPIFHYAKNTGRPHITPGAKYESRYLDCPNTPLYPFGYGLSYTCFEYSPIILSSNELNRNESITASVTVTNVGEMAGEEVVQLYIRDLVGSVTRPLRQLKGFKKISLEPSQSETISFEIDTQMLSFYRKDMTFGAEAGDFIVYIGGCSDTDNQAQFTLR